MFAIISKDGFLEWVLVFFYFIYLGPETVITHITAFTNNNHITVETRTVTYVTYTIVLEVTSDYY